MKISKETEDDIIQAWAKTNVLCAYLESPEAFVEPFNLKEQASCIFKLLDKAVCELANR